MVRHYGCLTATSETAHRTRRTTIKAAQAAADTPNVDHGAQPLQDSSSSVSWPWPRWQRPELRLGSGRERKPSSRCSRRSARPSLRALTSFVPCVASLGDIYRSVGSIGGAALPRDGNVRTLPTRVPGRITVLEAGRALLSVLRVPQLGCRRDSSLVGSRHHCGERRRGLAR